MSDFNVDPSAISYSQIKSQIEAWLQTLPDYDQWSLYYESTTGQTVIELIAGMMAFNKYDATTSRREALIQFALNRSSKIGGAQFLGYSAFRGRNAVLSITFVPANTLIYSKYDIIGSVKDRDLILLDSYVANAGVPLTVQCVMGQLQSEEILSPSESLNVFKFTQKNVSEDVRIFIDDVEVDFSTEVLGLLEGKFQLQSNVNGSVDAKFLNLSAFATKYFIGSVIRLDSVILKNVDFTLLDVALDETEGVLSAVEVTSFFQDIETMASIEVNAPIKNETKFVVRSRNDQPKLFKLLDPSIIDTSAKDVSAAIMEIFYLRTNDTRFTPDEKAQLVEDFDNYRPHGLLPPIVSDPHKVELTLDFIVYRETGVTGDIVAAIDSVLAGYEFKLGGSINIFDIEKALESELFIKVARVSYTANAWEANTGYITGALISSASQPSILLAVKEVLRKSGNAEPVWPVVPNELISDGRIVWKTIYNDALGTVVPWQANTTYRIGDTVKPSVPDESAYVAVSYLDFSSAVEPVWTPLAGALPEDFLGTIVLDGNLKWVARPLEGTPDVWAANTSYKIGEVVIPTNAIASDNIGVMWQLQDILGVTGATEPVWLSTVGAEYEDVGVVWKAVDATVPENTIDKSQYYVFTKNIEIR